MSDTEYGAALKLGKKQYQDAVAKGEYPYLPVLDDVLSYTDIVSTVSLGTMDIPLAKLVGTKTAGPFRSLGSHQFCQRNVHRSKAYCGYNIRIG